MVMSTNLDKDLVKSLAVGLSQILCSGLSPIPHFLCSSFPTSGTLAVSIYGTKEG